MKRRFWGQAPGGGGRPNLGGWRCSGARLKALAVFALGLVSAGTGLCLDAQAAASFRAHMIWTGNEPRLQVTIDPGTAASQTVWVSAQPFSQRGENPDGFSSGFQVKLPGDGKPVTTNFPVLAQGVPVNNLWTSLGPSGKEKISIPLDYIRVKARDDRIGLTGEELIYPFKPDSPLHSCTVRLSGGFENRKAVFALHFGPHRRGVEQKVAIEYHLLDAEGNQLLSGDDEIVLSDTQPTDYEKDVTPKRDTTGPYTVTFTANNEALQLSAASEARFPFATLLVPVSSMENDTLADWHIPGWPLADGDAKTTPRTLFSTYQPFVRPVFDSEVKRQGNRSLRIDYAPAGITTIGSNLRLPGLPMAARIWVKGNNTRDRLVLEWRDPCNFSTAAYQRWMNTLNVEICRLDFADWKCFTVPVLGDGLLGRDNRSYLCGQSGIEVRHPIQAPIHCAALRVIPEPSGGDAASNTAPRSVWIDDILVETQALRNERMTLELRGDTPERRLQADANLHIAVGNGTPYEIRNGRIAVTFLDGDGEQLKDADLAEGIDVPMGGVTVKTLPLAAIAARKPRGPVTAVVTVSGPVAGQRVQGRVVFSRPTGTALIWDFERREHFNPMAPAWYYQSVYHKDSMAMENGKTYQSLINNNRSRVSKTGDWIPAPEPLGADPVAGGAEGTAHALPLTITTNAAISVLLHPALPGTVESVEVQVFGDGVPVILQAVFADSRSPEFDMPFQQHASEPVRVDWKGWRACRFAAPPIPPAYDSKDGKGNPFYAPQYPLNLVLRARSEGGGPAAIRVDQIKVSTHLPKKQELAVELDYPDETMLHLAGQPLKLTLTSFAAEPTPVDARYQVLTPVGVVAQSGAIKQTLAPGSRTGVALIENLREGFYHVRLEGLPNGQTFEADVQAPDRKRYFGEDTMARLTDLRSLDGDLGLTEKRIDLDWDTSEPVPNLNHHNWFRRYAQAVSQEKAYEVVPIVGYCADWAGPEKQLVVADATYVRDVGSYMQAPVRLADWNAFMRNVGQEHAREFSKWVFWSSPDIPDPNPVFLPQNKYRNMFDIFCRWIRQYNPGACIVAGGFSFDRVLDYLAYMPDPDKLPFDQFEVRVNPGNVSTEEIQLENFLEDLDALLKLTAKRRVLISDLDWVTDERFALLDHAAYHARAAILLHVAGALPHQFASVNKMETRDGFGLLFHPVYGNSSIQNQRPFFVPKPAYFGLIETRKMLADLEYLQRTAVADRDPQANRACLFKQKDGNLCAVVWRVRGARRYRLPAEWTAVKATDAFGAPVALEAALPVGAMPLFLRFAATPVDRVAHELRNLKPLEPDKAHELVLEVVPAEAFSREAAEYKASGGDVAERRPGRLVAGERVNVSFLKNVTEERFAFRLDAAGDVLLNRLWFQEAGSGTNRTAWVALNSGDEQVWNLSPMEGLATSNTIDKIYGAGPKRSAFVLRGCVAGRNEVRLRHAAPAMSGGFRLTRIRDGKVDLTATGPLALAGRDADIPVQAFRNAAGGILTLGKQTYESGIGSMGATILEYPLNGQYSRFDVTVGIDAIVKGKGSVGFRILVDGQEKGKNSKSGPVTGMTLPKTLSVDGLEKAERLQLWVDDGGDGPENDLANWVEPVLTLKEAHAREAKP